MSSQYNVPPRKAANIRLALSKIAKFSQDISVVYAKKPRDVTATAHAIEVGVPGDDANCIEAVSLKDAGTPALVRRREVAVLEKTKTGQSVIILYSKSCEQTDTFDLTCNIDEMHRFSMYEWPRSWHPEYRQRLAKRRREEIKNGAKIKHRKSPRAVQQTAVRLTSFT